MIFNFINDNNEIVDSKTLFLYKTDLGTFISQVSNQINIDNYKAQQLNENLISTIEFDEYNATRNIDSALESHLKIDFQFNTPLQIATLYGYLKWTNNKGITFPLKNTYIELIGVCVDSFAFRNFKVISNYYTDGDGFYLFFVDVAQSDDSILDLPSKNKLYKYFVRIYSKTEHSEVLKKHRK